MNAVPATPAPQVAGRMLKSTTQALRASRWIQARLKRSITRNLVFPACSDVRLPGLMALGHPHLDRPLPQLKSGVGAPPLLAHFPSPPPPPFLPRSLLVDPCFVLLERMLLCQLPPADTCNRSHHTHTLLYWVSYCRLAYSTLIQVARYSALDMNILVLRSQCVYLPVNQPN